MIQVMAALRKLVGTVGAGFEMLQDFVDEIFQGILPASFVAKYAVQGFQSAMEARYSQPTSHTDEGGRARNHVPTSANARPISRPARVRNALATTGKYIADVMGSAGGKAAAGASLLFFAGDIVSDAIQNEKNKRLADLMPENFTLFGYTEIVNIFDDLESFLLEDSSCYVLYQYQRMNRTQDMTIFPCFDSMLRRYNKANSTEGTTSIDASQCWADASPSIGQNSLFSCTSSSTCCETTACEDGKLIPCGTCAEPRQALTKRYGCHSSLRKCVCGVPKEAIDRCSANTHCDAESQCELVSSMNTVSYGTIPCKLCPSKSQVLCLLQGSMPGACVCMLDSAVRFDTCSDQSGQETGVDSSKLCGYLHGQGLSSASSWTFDMEDLMVVPCAQVASGVCSTVYNTGRGRQSTIRMVVAASIRGWSKGRGRRLLMTEETEEIHEDAYARGYEVLSADGLHETLMADGWENAAEPCRALVETYQKNQGTTQNNIGVMDKYELNRCGFWRFVGRSVLEKHNLTTSALGQRHETFLISLDDLVNAIMSDGWEVGLILLRNPWVFGSAALYHPWMRPLRTLGVMVANHLEHVQWVREIDYDVHEALFGDEMPPQVPSRPVPEDGYEIYSRKDEAAARMPPLTESSGPHRKLLSVVDTADAVAKYSGQIIQGAPNARGNVPARVAGAWSTASFVWPPVYDYSGRACPLALSALSLGRQSVGLVGMYFRNFNTTRPAIDRSLRGNLPSWPWIGQIKTLADKEAVANATRSWASWVFHRVLDVVGVRPSHLVAFFTSDQKWALQWILETAIKCDLASVLTCSRHDKDLVMSSVVFVLGYIAVATVSGALGLRFLSTVYILSYPGFIMWYVFGMPLSCFPMIPTCVLSDIIATAEALVPVAYMFPTNLLCNTPPGGVQALNQTCLRSCSELNFTRWEDPLAFAICDTDPLTCRYLFSEFEDDYTGIPLIDSMLWNPLRHALQRFEWVVSRQGHGLAGHRLCTWVSFVTATPVIGLAGICIVVSSAVLMAALDLVPSTVAFFGQMYVFYTAGSG